MEKICLFCQIFRKQDTIPNNVTYLIESTRKESGFRKKTDIRIIRWEIKANFAIMPTIRPKNGLEKESAKE